MTPTPTEAYRPFDAVLVRYPMVAEAGRATPAFYAPEIDHRVVEVRPNTPFRGPRARHVEWDAR